MLNEPLGHQDLPTLDNPHDPSDYVGIKVTSLQLSFLEMLLDNINHKDKNELNVVEFDDFLQYIFCLNICAKSNYLGTNVLLAATA